MADTRFASDEVRVAEEAENPMTHTVSTTLGSPVGVDGAIDVPGVVPGMVIRLELVLELISSCTARLQPAVEGMPPLD